VIRALLLFALPCAAADLFLTPSSFVVSQGERISITIEGAQWTVAAIKDPVLIASSGVYNLTNLRAVDGVPMVDGNAKAKGSLIAAAQGTYHGQQYFAKTLLTCEAADATARKIVGHALEIVPESVLSGGLVSIQVWLRGKPAAGVPVEIVSNGSAGVTGAEGRLRLKLSDAGVYRIVAAHESMRASFSFEYLIAHHAAVGFEAGNVIADRFDARRDRDRQQ
jgi:hypothetical protein